MTRRAPAIALIGLVLAAAACARGGPDTASPGADGTLGGQLTVAAASSLTEAFTEMGDTFESRHPETDITFSFASSSSLAQQVRDGAPADVFASADVETMERLVAEGLVVGEPQIFAANELVIVTRPGNPLDVTGPADLADVPVVALCAENAPCGRLSAVVLDRDDVVLEPGRVTEAADAKATLGAVTHGDADAALVYATDARAAGDAVHTVPLANTATGVTTYPIAAVAGSGQRNLADAFISHVVSADGREVLADHGFAAP